MIPSLLSMPIAIIFFFAKSIHKNDSDKRMEERLKNSP